MRDRLFQALLVGSTIAFSWLAMQAVHELGHVLHLWLTGGSVAYVILHPLATSMTHAAENPRPLIVAWGGAIWGCIVPLGLLLFTQAIGRQFAYLARFFAGFCLIANGAYLATDAFVRGGDGRELITYGSPAWLLVLFGVTALPSGLWLWNGLGPRFGLGQERGQVNHRHAIAMAMALAALVWAELALSPRQ